ncbi:hypothetical protein DN069_06615 [Streptacidiphilus pinicola]|uniref:DUF3618 domain-containing protein n=1 Tax=Streptacidiphilus pinicola TaxID=2219663 RepID=A0A2X0J878_9ACTN|nr:hypothetical protein [Streptacidiphilus pinicola]RAG86476.1 hypothetical protein DN069_06615 [Streptacidiphilus pinicola]
MGSTFTQAKEKTTTAAHSVSDGAAVVRHQAARMARRAADETATLIGRAQHRAADTAKSVKGATATGTTTRTKTLIGLGAAAVVAALTWLGLRGRVD